MPPPNITGKLHLGHALFLTLQDILTRYYRKLGYSTLWLPGTDHAGLATHEKIIGSLGSSYTKEQYLEKGWEWKNHHHAIITSQIKKMGASCDWSRERFTLDAEYQKSTIEALKICHEKKMLYKKDNQWYLDMSEPAKDLINAIEKNEISITPQSDTKQLLNFLYHIEPWCISRQIPWGQQIPIYSANHEYCIASHLGQAQELLKTSQACQDKDTLDTWFLSSLWPFATLGWPSQTEDYHKFYPAQLIETADDILFFWCARMLMMGKICTGIYPFKEIFLHGIIRDSKGRKMSKSLGNGIDPQDIIKDYGTDALRWALATHTMAGQDMKISQQDFIAAKKFTNKIWQAGRFFHQHCQNMEFTVSPTHHLDEFEMIYRQHIENYEFLQASTKLQNSFKHDFCDTWIEQHKQSIFNQDSTTLSEGLSIYLKYLSLFEPFMPFICHKLKSYYL